MDQPTDQLEQDQSGRQEETQTLQPRQISPRIESDPGILGGRPVIAGTRLSVEVLLENLAGGDTFEDLI